MAQFLDTMEITSAIQRILKNAKERVVLISPYVDFDPRYKTLIKEKNDEHIRVTLVWGKKKKQFKFSGEEKDWIKSLEFVDDIFCKELHAKCYLNESEAIIASMNLYKASQENIEMGVLITKQEDKEAYDNLWKEVKRIIKEKPNHFVIKKISTTSSEEGHCIRCGTKIKMDPKHPYCITDYQKRKKFGDESYVEKSGFCHICGKPNSSSMEKPVCMDCYKKNKKLFKDF
jgi:phosphatidylserine/phosphatidylglycerophosphate/cardiolipin synthase-like enzyme